jgi:signal transduction histidine kinase
VTDPLYASNRLRRLVEGAAAVAGQTDLHAVLTTTVEIGMELTGARYGALGVVGDDGGLIDFLHRGLSDAEANAISHQPEGLGVLGTITRKAETVRLADISEHPDSVGFPDGHPKMHTFLGVPIRAGVEVFGNLYLTDPPGEFGPEDEAIVEALAMIAGSAVRTVRLQRRLRTLAVVEDRERIARDLHDTVIQNLFGAGLSLQALSQKIDDPELRTVLDLNVRTLNDSIAGLREFIFDLNQPMGLPEEIGELIADLVGLHDVSIDVSYTGNLRGMPDEVVDNAILIVREAVSNAIRHSESTKISVQIHGEDKSIRVIVMDDGIGFDPTAETGGLGLANLRTRALRLGGELRIDTAPGRGATVEVRLPV